MAGYSGTPLPKKLGLKEGQRVAIVAAPEGFDRELGPLPNGAVAARRGELDFAMLFAARQAALARELAPLMRRLAPAGMLWVAWPKKASGVATDLTFDVVQRHGLELGLVDIKSCAVDDVWSGLKFVRRLADRATAKPKRSTR